MKTSFLAAMSSSRSGVVTKCVHSFVRSSLFLFLLVSLEFYLVLKCFNGVLKKFRGCLKFQGCFKDVSRMLQGRFNGFYRKFQGCFEEI